MDQTVDSGLKNGETFKKMLSSREKPLMENRFLTLGPQTLKKLKLFTIAKLRTMAARLAGS